jgi:large subunit ribosomal protein L25
LEATRRKAAHPAAFDVFGTARFGPAANAPENAKGKAMSETYELKADARERVGKGSAREVRRNGKVPAVIYGDKQPPLAIALSYKDLYYKIHGGGFLTTLATIDVAGDKIQVLPKDYQLDPVRDFPIHVDFLRVGADTEVNVEVPVHFINEDKSPGIKRGGVLNIVRHQVEFHCRANAIPEFIAVDLEGTDIGDSIHISAVKLPEGVRPVIADRDFTVATVAGSSAMKPEPTETAPEAEAAEPAAAAEPAEAPKEKK